MIMIDPSGLKSLFHTLFIIYLGLGQFLPLSFSYFLCLIWQMMSASCCWRTSQAQSNISRSGGSYCHSPFCSDLDLCFLIAFTTNCNDYLWFVKFVQDYVLFMSDSSLSPLLACNVSSKLPAPAVSVHGWISSNLHLVCPQGIFICCQQKTKL